MFAFALWVGYVALTRRCYWVRVGADGRCEFRALLRRTRVHAREILALERSSSFLFWYSGDEPSTPDNTKVVFAGGSVVVVQPLDVPHLPPDGKAERTDAERIDGAGA